MCACVLMFCDQWFACSFDKVDLQRTMVFVATTEIILLVLLLVIALLILSRLNKIHDAPTKRVPDVVADKNPKAQKVLAQESSATSKVEEGKAPVAQKANKANSLGVSGEPEAKPMGVLEAKVQSDLKEKKLAPSKFLEGEKYATIMKSKDKESVSVGRCVKRHIEEKRVPVPGANEVVERRLVIDVDIGNGWIFTNIPVFHNADGDEFTDGFVSMDSRIGRMA